MAAPRVPVLWTCGPPGAGKTTAGWAVFSALRLDGIPVAYADIDQLGMCYPERPGDPGRHRMKTANLGAIIASYAAAGARCVVVSGVNDPVLGADPGLLPQAALTVCHLQASDRELARRLAGRDGARAGAGHTAEDSATPPAGEWRIDTTARPAAGVAELILSRWPGRPGDPAGSVSPATAPGRRGPDPAVPPAAAGGEVLLICGATGTGKSAAGFGVYQRELRAGRCAAYVDLDQVGFCSPGPPGALGGHRLRARNLAALWRTFRLAGATLLVTAGPVESADAVRAYSGALPGALVTVCGLHADPAELRRRIRRRGAGHGWAQPGDPLAGLPAGALAEAAARAAAAAGRIEAAGLGTVRVDTSGRTIEAVAAEVAARALARAR